MKLQSIQSGTLGQPCIVFLHGVGSDATVWRNQMQAFPEFHCLAFDMPGYRGSPFLEAPLAPEIARRVLESLPQGSAPIHVVGLSLGAIVAAHMAAQAPSKVASLVLASGFKQYPDGVQVAHRAQAAARLGMTALAVSRVAKLLAPTTPHGDREKVVTTMANIPVDSYCQMAQVVWTADLTGVTPSIRAPTLVLNGDLDEITTPERGAELAIAIRQATFHVIAGASHLLNLDAPKLFNAHVRNHILATRATTATVGGGT